MRAATRAELDTTETGAAPRADADLVRAAQAGSRDAFAKLVSRHKLMVHSVARALAGTQGGSEEVAHDAFVLAWMQIGRLRGADNFRAWIYQITRTAHRQYWREQGRRRRWTSQSAPRWPPTEVASAEPSPLERAIAGEEQRILWQALEEIPEGYRLALVLYYGEHRSTDSVAETLGLSVKTVTKRLSLGRRMLQERVSAVESGLARLPLPKEAFTAAVLLAITGATAAARAAPSLNGRARPQASIPGLKALIIGGGALLMAAAVVVTLTPAGRRDVRNVSSGATSSAGARHSPRAFAFEPGASTPASPVTAGKRTESAPVRQPTALVNYDFEDGVQPVDLTFCQVVPGPPRPGNRFSVISGLGEWNTKYYFALTPPIDRRPMLHYAGTTLVRFDYWIDEPVTLVYQIYDFDKLQNYNIRLNDLVVRRWGHAEIAFSTLRGQTDQSKPAEPGDRVDNMMITGSRAGALPYYIDNFSVVEGPVGGM